MSSCTNCPMPQELSAAGTGVRRIHPPLAYMKKSVTGFVLGSMFRARKSDGWAVVSRGCIVLKGEGCSCRTGPDVDNKRVVMVSKLSVRMICFEWLMVCAANII